MQYENNDETTAHERAANIIGVKTRVLDPEQFGEVLIHDYNFPGRITDLVPLAEDEVIMYCDYLATPKLNIFLNDGQLKYKRVMKSQKIPNLGLFLCFNIPDGDGGLTIHISFLDKMYRKSEKGYVRKYRLWKREVLNLPTIPSKLMKPPSPDINTTSSTGEASGSQVSKRKLETDEDELLVQSQSSIGSKDDANSAQRLTRLIMREAAEEYFASETLASRVDSVINELTSAIQEDEIIHSSSLTRRGENGFIDLMKPFADVTVVARIRDREFCVILYDMFKRGTKRYYSSLPSDQKMSKLIDSVLGRSLSYVEYFVLFNADPKGGEMKLFADVLEYVAPISRGSGQINTPDVVNIFRPFPIINFLFGMTNKKDGTQLGFLISLLYHLSTLCSSFNTTKNNFQVFDLSYRDCNHSLYQRYCASGINVDSKRLISNSALEVNVDLLEVQQMLLVGKLDA